MKPLSNLEEEIPFIPVVPVEPYFYNASRRVKEYNPSSAHAERIDRFAKTLDLSAEAFSP